MTVASETSSSFERHSARVLCSVISLTSSGIIKVRPWPCGTAKAGHANLEENLLIDHGRNDVVAPTHIAPRHLLSCWCHRCSTRNVTGSCNLHVYYFCTTNWSLAVTLLYRTRLKNHEKSRRSEIFIFLRASKLTRCKFASKKIWLLESISTYLDILWRISYLVYFRAHLENLAIIYDLFRYSRDREPVYPGMLISLNHIRL